MLSNRAAIKAFLKYQKTGTILNMGSVLGFSPTPRLFATHAYAAAKSAIIGFSKSLAACYADKVIRVNVIAPALVETPMAQAAGYRRLEPMFPDFLDFKVDELHVEMANREFSEVELIAKIGESMNVAVGVVDVKSYYIESVEDIEHRIKRCLEYAKPESLSVAPDCGLSQTARWAAKKKLNNMVLGAQRIREAL